MLPPPEALRLAASLSDTPRWIETRAMLLSGRCIVTGGETVDRGFVVIERRDTVSAVSVVGRPPWQTIVDALEDISLQTAILGQVDNAAWIEGALATVSATALPWRAETVIVHLLDDPDRVSAVDGHSLVRLLRLDDALDHLPRDLRHEMTHAQMSGPVAAVFADGLAASFCYPCWQTERLWDVSIDTLEGYRGRSLAATAVRFMIDHMRRHGRLPVWGALETNSASLRLAARLGFVAADRLVVFSRGHRALPTGA
jgi:GNAT superfamily N-acetyltransferase